jgi:hypothetical protein
MCSKSKAFVFPAFFHFLASSKILLWILMDVTVFWNTRLLRFLPDQHTMVMGKKYVDYDARFWWNTIYKLIFKYLCNHKLICRTHWVHIGQCTRKCEGHLASLV